MQFKDLERKATRLAGQVAQKGSELLDAGKMKLAISKEEHAIDELYYKIGEAVYQQLKNEGDIPEYLSADIAAIDAHKRRVDELKNNAKQDTAYSDKAAAQDDIIIDITADSEYKETNE